MLFLAASVVAAPDLDMRLSKEIDRLEATLRAIDSPSLGGDARPILEGDRTLLARARAAKSPFVRLYRLRDAAIGVETLRYVIEHKPAEADLAHVQALADAQRSAIEKPLAPLSGPALQLALRQITANRAEKLFRASVPFGKAASPANGLFYLGEAEGNRKFRDFVDSLSFGSVVEPRPNKAAIHLALEKLDTAALVAFETDPAGRSAVSLSARLKEARELADRGFLEGAALTLLEAQLDISRRAEAPAKTAGASPMAHDDSISAMFQAEAREDGGDTSRIVANDILPLYASLFASTGIEKKIPKNVTVTLVRWPYT
jgi:hypothetical protein